MSEENQSQVVSKQKQGNTPAFLDKLFDILEDNQAHSHLIAWQSDGTSFIIKKVSDFSEIVLPRYFKHSNIQSYVRQLNMYGFSKTRHDSNHHEFSHRLFLKGRRDLLPFIRRKTQSGGKNGHSHIPEDILKTLKPTPAGVSSEAEAEASQSDNMEEELLDMMDHTSPAMQLRVVELEEQVSQLTKACNELLHQHNFLCEALQSQQDEEIACPNCSFTFKPNTTHTLEAVPETNANNKRTLASTTQDETASSSSPKRIKRSGSIDDPSATTDGATDYETAHETSFQDQEQPADDTPFAPVHAHRRQQNFFEFKANFDVSRLLSMQTTNKMKMSPALEPLSLELVNKSSRPSSNDGKGTTRSNSISSSSNNNKNKKSMKLLLPPFAQRSSSLDLGGLEAITAAATYLDDRHPLAPGQEASSSNISGGRSSRS